jgi:fructoselysine-6-P-deglycase FrlB-like protein
LAACTNGAQRFGIDGERRPKVSFLLTGLLLSALDHVRRREPSGPECRNRIKYGTARTAVGKPYQNELAALDQTYAEVLIRDAHTCDDMVRALAGSPLVAIASGGSSTAGEALATLHQLTTGQLARVVTPLELATTPFDLRRTSAVLFSAGGRNPDILRALDHLVSRDPRHIFVVCGNSASPLAKRAREVAFASCVHVPSPQGKDGYLATNSLLAFVTSIAAAYATVYPITGAMPSSLRSDWNDASAFTQLRDRDHMLVLFDPALRHAAADIESRFSEGALGTVALADFRNFAHGRHLWLALRRKNTAVVALFRDEMERVAERTLGLIPEGVPIVKCDARGTPLSSIVSALCFSLRLAGAVGEMKGMDPGRPHVPDFGRRLYNARLIPKPSVTTGQLAMYRKVGLSGSMRLSGELGAFVERLRRARLGAAILDYDGTICSHSQRFGEAHAESLSQLTRLLRGGLRIGIATGRGKSLITALRPALPRNLWQQVTVGYYNCGLIAALSEDPPEWTLDAPPSLRLLSEELRTDPSLQGRVEIELRNTQLTVKPAPGSMRCDDLIAMCAAYASRANDGLSVVRSTHSIDILPRGVNKTLLARSMARETRADVLAIGDQGRWPGNDYALLDTVLALSVDSTSPSWSTCWNVAPRGLRGPAATAHYLRACKNGRDGWRVDLPLLLGKEWA